MTENEDQQKDAKPEYMPTAQELQVIAKHVPGIRSEISPNLKVLDDGRTFKPNHQNALAGQLLLMEAVGTTNYDFYNGLLAQLANAARRGGEVHEGELNFLLSVVKGIKPRDQLEAMLAAQMAAIHSLAMRLAGQLARCETIQQRDSTERALNKLLRTFATQMETFKRHRAGVEHKVVVQQVSVSDGGQAIVGNVTQTTSETTQDKAETSRPAITAATTAPMPMIEKREHAPVALPREQENDE